jgi:integrase
VREVPIPADLRRELRGAGARVGAAQADLVFPGADGAAMSHYRLARMLAKAAKLVDLAWVTPHVLRHTYASRWLRDKSRKDLAESKLLMGHEDIRETIDTYGHLVSGDLSPAQPQVAPLERPVD